MWRSLENQELAKKAYPRYGTKWPRVITSPRATLCQADALLLRHSPSLALRLIKNLIFSFKTLPPPHNLHKQFALRCPPPPTPHFGDSLAALLAGSLSLTKAPGAGTGLRAHCVWARLGGQGPLARGLPFLKEISCFWALTRGLGFFLGLPR